MIEQGPQNLKSFHLAGIIPTAGQPLDFNFPWHDSMQPIAPDYLAVERAVVECAYAGCETIWIVCHNEMQPLIKHRIGDYIQDPTRYYNKYENIPSDLEKPIPIYYVPIHPKDRDKRDCLGWGVLHGALSAYWLSKKISKWVIPDKYYVAFPYGVYQPWVVKENRKIISSKNPFFLSSNGKTIKNNKYLGFTFDAEDFKICRKTLRKESTGINTGYDEKRLPIEDRWSARFFSLSKVFSPVKADDARIIEVSWYYDIHTWDGLCKYLGSEEQKQIKRPSTKILGNHKFNPIGVK